MICGFQKFTATGVSSTLAQLSGNQNVVPQAVCCVTIVLLSGSLNFTYGGGAASPNSPAIPQNGARFNATSWDFVNGMQFYGPGVTFVAYFSDNRH